MATACRTKRRSVEERSAQGGSLNDISIDRMAIDLFRCVTCAFKVKPDPIPKTTLKTNSYSSLSFIKEFARPINFYAIVLRDVMKGYFEKCLAAVLGNSKDNFVIVFDALFNSLKKKAAPNIFRQVILSVVTCAELIQYLNFYDQRGCLKEVPDIWTIFFMSELHDEFEIGGGFKAYLCYWEFLKETDEFTSKYLKLCYEYGKHPVSEEFKAKVIKLQIFEDKELLKRVFGADSDSKDGARSMLIQETIDRIGFLPHDMRFPVEEKEDSAKGSKETQPKSSVKKRSKKLKPKPGQSYARFKAERKAEAEKEKAKNEVEKAQKETEKAASAEEDEESS